MNEDNITLKDLEAQLVECKIMAVPKDTKFVMTIGEDKEAETFFLDLLNTSGDLTLEETHEALADIYDQLVDIVDVLEWHIEEKYRTLEKSELKSKFKIIKGEE